ncbi:3'-5' exonuclease [Candidatus Gracilibacteria bacterium]|nr:3'-5' exonuclease [Candidatus Gracilibacteria bacterium]
MENQPQKGTYLLMDLEMTGLNPFQHGVIEVGMMVLNIQFETIGEFLIDLCPPEDIVIDRSSLEYNGFTLDRIAAGRSYEEFCDMFTGFYATYFTPEHKPIIVGQYITADIVFLSSIFDRSRRSILMDSLGNDIIDTKSIANQANAIARYNNIPLPFQSTSLSKPGGLTDKFGISGYEAHTAKGDMLATREVLLKFLHFKK